MFKLTIAAAIAVTVDADYSRGYGKVRSYAPRTGYHGIESTESRGPYQKTRTISKKTVYDDYAPMPHGDRRYAQF